MGKWMDDDVRFDMKYTIRDDNECWLWEKTLDKDGYGRFWIDGHNEFAHRYSYRRVKGDITPGYVIMHICDVRNCVNPSHLKQGTQGDNNRDMFAKGRNMNFKGQNNPMNKLTEFQVLKIRSLHAAGFSMTELAKTFNISRRHVYNIVNKVQWKDLQSVKGIAELRNADSKVLPNKLDGVSVQGAE